MLAFIITAALLFALLVPGTVVSLPSKGSKYTLIVHAIVFALALYFVGGIISDVLNSVIGVFGIEGARTAKQIQACNAECVRTSGGNSMRLMNCKRSC